MTRFSVVLPTYDRSAAIRPTIDGVLAQTDADWELIVVSDASTDDTDAVVCGYDDPRVRLVRLAEHAGHPSPPRNRGLAEARGELIAYLDHDDVWEPGHLAELRTLLSGDARAAATGARHVDRRGRSTRPATRVVDAVWGPSLQVMGPLFEPSRVGHRRGLAEAVGGWRAEPAGLEDWSLWLRLADAGERFATSTRPTVRLLEHEAARRASLPVRFELRLGRMPSAAHATHALTLLGRAPLRTRLRELHVACAQRWHAALDADGELALPRGSDRAELPGLVGEHVPEDTLSTLVGVRPAPDGAAILARPLPCTSAEHADRIEGLTRAHFGPKLAFATRVMRAVAALPGDVVARAA
jgi:hypothetical protein